MRELPTKLNIGQPNIIPEVRNLFWEYDKRTITWTRDKDLIIQKILHHGSWNTLRWLRRNLTDSELRDWIISRGGAGLDAKKLRYWQLILDIPKKLVDEWISINLKNPWSGRNM